MSILLPNRIKMKINSACALPDKYTVRLFLNRLRKNIISLVTFSQPKNVDEAIEAAKQVESSQYYKQQSPVLTKISGNDELEQVLDYYEEEELSEIEVYMADSQEEYKNITDLLSLDYNPWNEENSVYLTLISKEEFESNPVVFLAETSKKNIWKIEDDL
ncbi:13942_t:CDS:2 [Funneliformis caledonium]|uniref:13942_t:CDS:1 n=1 Tax=Funneliformis caledonium TaxID=1117310 RepID=A0A9N9B7J2_9GLOM|nr:13942_t:CDS:2 [Funneliformis caledonium]